MSVEKFHDANNALIALVIRQDAKVSGINFITPAENELQVGLMTRSENSPVLPHKHNLNVREIQRTQEVLIIRSGMALVTVWGGYLQPEYKITLSRGDMIMFLDGAHKIDFLETTEILEIKQGPFISDLDKTYL
jgi:hypothetical protein